VNGYRVELARAAEKELDRLPGPIVQRVIEAVRGLRDNARPRGAVKLRGEEGAYRIRVGRYRVIYEVDEEHRLVLVSHVRHRKDAYQ
jgi:mRNA interferase RelE/StbE